MAHRTDVSRPAFLSQSVQPHATTRTPLGDVADPRFAAFTSETAPQVFHSVCHRHEIWRADPFDVEQIHAAARECFERLLERQQQPAAEPAGKLLLILGESGSGKTHLMRVFRNSLQGERRGYCGYLQMTSATDDYDRYVLSNLIDSLDQPYCETDSPASGLMMLSRAVVDAPSSILRKEREAIREDRYSDKELAKVVARLADLIIEDERYADCDVHLVQTMLYLQRDEPRLKSRVLSYLRCEDLSQRDRDLLGGIVPRTDPARMIEDIGRLMWRVEKKPLVVCVDQLEDMANLDRDAERFRRAMQTVCALAERVPSSLFVIACLEDLYPPLKQSLTRSYVDRIEHDPEPIRLESRRSWDEIVGLVGRRLQCLLESCGAPFDAADPTYPIPTPELEALTNTRTRDVLDWCRNYQRAVTKGESVPSTVPGAAAAGTHDDPLVSLTQLWNDALAEHSVPTSDDELELATLLANALRHAATELGEAASCRIDDVDTVFDAEIVDAEGVGGRVCVGVCNRSPLGGALSRQVESVVAAAEDAVPILVRSTEFPAGSRTKIGRQIKDVTTNGGRCVIVEDADWRCMHAFAKFQRDHGDVADFAEWLRVERPLAQLKSLRSILTQTAVRG